LRVLKLSKWLTLPLKKIMLVGVKKGGLYDVFGIQEEADWTIFNSSPFTVTYLNICLALGKGYETKPVLQRIDYIYYTEALYIIPCNIAYCL